MMVFSHSLDPTRTSPAETRCLSNSQSREYLDHAVAGLFRVLIAATVWAVAKSSCCEWVEACYA